MTREQIKRILGKKIRTCTTLHHCELCNQVIMAGERYHDGGYGRRIHAQCMVKYCMEEGL